LKINGAKIVKIGLHLTNLSLIMQCPVVLWTTVYWMCSGGGGLTAEPIKFVLFTAWL